MEQDRPIATRVVEAVAEQKGVDPLEMRPPLYDAIDPDGLNALFPDTLSDRESTARVEFSYDEYVITVESSGTIDVTERAIDGTREQIAVRAGANRV